MSRGQAAAGLVITKSLANWKELLLPEGLERRFGKSPVRLVVLCISSLRGHKGTVRSWDPLQAAVIPKPGDFVAPGSASNAYLAFGRWVHRKTAQPREPVQQHCSLGGDSLRTVRGPRAMDGRTDIWARNTASQLVDPRSSGHPLVPRVSNV